MKRVQKKLVFKTLIKIAAAFNVSIDYLLGLQQLLDESRLKNIVSMAKNFTSDEFDLVTNIIIDISQYNENKKKV